MELFTELAKHPETLAELSGRLRLHPRSAKDFLDALVSLNFLERRNGTYYNTPSTDLFLDKRKPSYIGGMLEMANNRLYRYWGNLTTGLRTGEPQNEVHSGEGDPFKQIYADPERLRNFLRAMTGVSQGANMAIAEKFPFASYKSAVDVGTAQGDLITQVALANPNITGIGFDLPVVAPIFEDYVADNHLDGRVHFHPGSFWDDPIPQGERRRMMEATSSTTATSNRRGCSSAKSLAMRPPAPRRRSKSVYESIIDDDRSKNSFGLLASLNTCSSKPPAASTTPAPTSYPAG